MLPPDDATKAQLYTLRTIHIALLGAVIIYGIILYVLVPNLDFQTVLTDDPKLTYVTIVLGVVSVICIYLGFFTPKWMFKFTKTTYGEWAIYLVRIALFESVGVYGLILGVLGVDWQISLPFLVVSLVALLRIFPKVADVKNTLGE